MKRWWIGVGAALAIITGILWGVGGRRTAPPETPKEAAGVVRLSKESEDLIRIQTAPVRRTDLVQTVTVSGRIEPIEGRVTAVGVPAPGRVSALLVQSGQQVRNGDTLLVVQSQEVSQTQATLSDATAHFKYAESRLQRTLNMARLGVFSEERYEKAREELLTARSQAVAAEARLEAAAVRKQRAEELHREDIMSRQDWESIQAEHRQTEAEAQRARAVMTIAQKHLKREETVRRQGYWNTTEVEQARVERDRARIDLEAARRRLATLGGRPGGGSEILARAPRDGWVTAVETAPGAVVDPDHGLVRVADLTQVWAAGDVFAAHIGRVQVGQRATVRMGGTSSENGAEKDHAGAPPEPLGEGTIEFVGREVDPRTNSVEVRVRLGNPGGTLRPGAFVELIIETSRRPAVLAIPLEAVVREKSGTAVFVRTASGEYRRIAVTLGETNDTMAEVRAGLSPGEIVVVRGQQQLLAELGKESLGEGLE